MHSITVSCFLLQYLTLVHFQSRYQQQQILSLRRVCVAVSRGRIDHTIQKMRQLGTALMNSITVTTYIKYVMSLSYLEHVVIYSRSTLGKTHYQQSRSNRSKSCIQSYSTIVNRKQNARTLYEYSRHTRRAVWYVLTNFSLDRSKATRSVP